MLGKIVMHIIKILILSLCLTTSTSQAIDVEIIGDEVPVDTTSWNQALIMRLLRDLSISGNNLLGSANQFSQVIQGTAQVTNSVNSYEKAGLLVIMQQNDKSSNGINRDLVGVDQRSYIGPINLMGRAWGGLSAAHILHGGDGLLISHEFEIKNLGTFQPGIDTTTSKYNIHLVSLGPNPATAGIIFSGASSWKTGIHIRNILADGTAIEYYDNNGNLRFKVSADGTVWAKKFKKLP
jgi:hypothetical protein